MLEVTILFLEHKQQVQDRVFMLVLEIRWFIRDTIQWMEPPHPGRFQQIFGITSFGPMMLAQVR